MISLGSSGVFQEGDKTVHRFFPIAYIFVQSENTFVSEKSFETMKKCALEFFSLDMDVKVGSLDHSYCIKNAFENVWPGIKLVTCWPHFMHAFFSNWMVL